MPCADGVTIEDLRQAVEEGHGIQKSMTSVVMREATVNRMRKRSRLTLKCNRYIYYNNILMHKYFNGFH